MQGNDGNHKRPSGTYRAALVVLALITGLTAGAGPVCEAAAAGRTSSVSADAGNNLSETETVAEKMSAISGVDRESDLTESEDIESSDTESDGTESPDTESDGTESPDTESDGTESPDTESDDTETADTESEDNASDDTDGSLSSDDTAENLDYILGRPLTEEEIEEQKDLEPSKLSSIPVIYGPEADEVDLDEVVLEGSAADADTLPSSYDSRTQGIVTAVKNQNTRTTNLCWAFSAASCAETSMLRQGLTIDGEKVSRSTLDLSELQLGYFFYHPTADSMGNAASDTTDNISGKADLMTGNHNIFMTLCLANWTGMAEETTAPYTDASSTLTLDPELCYGADVAHMQNSYWVNMNDTEAAKLLIRKYGSLSASFYWAEKYHNYDTAAYYNSSSLTTSNHTITIVGWDDDYLKENFGDESEDASDLPENDGAWLVKNSWGSGWGDEGYFWISYEDKGLTGATMPLGYAYDFDSSDNYDYIYEYDGTCGYGTRKIASGSSVANVFTVSGTDSGAECLEAVSLGIYSTNVDYSLQIYKNPEDGDPAGGEAMLDQPQTGTFSYMGYMTVPLDEAVCFNEGDTFSVVFTLTSGDDSAETSDIYVLRDRTYKNGSWVSFTNMTEPGQSYVSSAASGSEDDDTDSSSGSDTDCIWTDLGLNSDGTAAGTSGSSIRIKAFTSEWKGIVSVTLSDTEMTLLPGKSMTLTAETAPADAEDDTTVTWTSSDTSVAVVENGRVTAVGPGSAVIRAEAGYNKVSAECTVTVVGSSAITSWKALSAKQIQLSWSKAEGADGYRLYRRKDGESWKGVAVISSADTLTYTDSSVPDYSNYYYYTVRAYAQTEDGTLLTSYDTTGVRTQAVPLKPALTGVTNSSSGVTVKWSSVLCDGYKIYRKESGGSWKEMKILTGSDLVTWKDTSVVKGKIYCYTVRAYFLSGTNYARSSYDAAGVEGYLIPATPTLNSVTKSSTGLTVKWSKVTCDGYKIYRKESGGSWKGLRTISASSTVSYKDTTAVKGKTYYYTVRAYYKIGTSYALSSYNTTGVKGTR